MKAKKVTPEERALAQKQIEANIRRLAILRDLLLIASKNDREFSAMDAGDTCDYAYSMLCTAGGELEQALFDLGITPGMEAPNGQVEGWFKEYLKA